MPANEMRRNVWEIQFRFDQINPNTLLPGMCLHETQPNRKDTQLFKIDICMHNCILILSTPNVWIKTVFTLTHLSKVWCLLRLSGLSQSSQLKRISWLSLVPPSFLEPAPAPPPSPRAVYLSGWCRGRGLLSQEHEIDECVRSKPRMELHGKWYEGKGGSSIREAGKLGGDTSPMVNGTLSHLFYGSYFKPGGSN
jgi:hypothetical protein